MQILPVHTSGAVPSVSSVSTSHVPGSEMLNSFTTANEIELELELEVPHSQHSSGSGDSSEFGVSATAEKVERRYLWMEVLDQVCCVCLGSAEASVVLHNSETAQNKLLSAVRKVSADRICY
jgi:hypothetical protein